MRPKCLPWEASIARATIRKAAAMLQPTDNPSWPLDSSRRVTLPAWASTGLLPTRHSAWRATAVRSLDTTEIAGACAKRLPPAAGERRVANKRGYDRAKVTEIRGRVQASSRPVIRFFRERSSGMGRVQTMVTFSGTTNETTPCASYYAPVRRGDGAPRGFIRRSPRRRGMGRVALAILGDPNGN